MEAEEAPLSLDEYLLRRIPADWCDESLPIPILRAAFAPNRRDVDGISLFREQFIEPQVLAEAGRSSNGYYVARLAVKDIYDLKLTLIVDPVAGLPGHVLIPELRLAVTRGSTKNWAKEIEHNLAKIASINIVLRPRDYMQEI